MKDKAAIIWAEHGTTLLWILLVLVALALIVALVVLWVRLRRRRSRGAAPAVRPRYHLAEAIAQFRRNVPREHLRKLTAFRPVWVFGDAGSGKSALIDRVTDWRAQEALFHPSHTEDPHLQIYQDARALALEVSPTLMLDAQVSARRALQGAAEALKGHPSPEAVVVLDGRALAEALHDGLEHRAKLVRGKLDALASVHGAPLPFSIALTHLDEVEGFPELAAAIQRSGHPFALQPGELPTRAQLEGMAEPLHAFLPGTLVSGQAAEYVRAQAFLSRLPKTLRALATFVTSLQERDPRSSVPPLQGILLTGAGVPHSHRITTGRPQTEAPRPTHRLPLRHVVGAAALAGLGLAWIYGGLAFDEGAQNKLKRHVDAWIAQPRDTSAFQRLEAAVAEHERGGSRAFTPRYFAPDPAFGLQIVHEHFVQQVRSKIIRPALGRALAAGDGPSVLYALSLYYASTSNSLGLALKERTAEFTDALGLPAQLMHIYAEQNRVPMAAPSLLDDREFDRRFGLTPLASPQGFNPAGFAADLDAAQQADLLDAETVRELSDTIPHLIEGQRVLDRANHIAGVAALLNEVTGMHFGRQWPEALAAYPSVNVQALNTIQSALAGTDLGVPVDGAADLGALLFSLRADAAVNSGPYNDVVFSDSPAAGEPPGVFRPGDWARLAARTRVQRRIHAFLETPRPTSDSVFFGPSPAYPPVNLGGGKAARFFTGTGRVPGIYTQRAFKEKVRPALEVMPATLTDLPLNVSSRERFEGFIEEATEQYATAYAEAWSELFASFGYGARSGLDVRVSFAELSRPTSPLKRMLTELSRNTAIEGVDTHAHLAVFDVVAGTLEFARELVPSNPDEGAPLLDEYLELLGQTAAALSGEGGKKKGDKKDKPAGLVDLLSPAGQLALAMHLGDEENFADIIDEWVAAAAIPREHAGIFTAPIRMVYGLGVRDIEARIADLWEALEAEHLAPLKKKYPFRKGAKDTAPAASLEAAFHPEGALFEAIHTSLGSIVTERRGRWEQRSSRFGSLRLPSRMLTTLEWCTKIRDTLWDSKGDPKAIAIKARPDALPRDVFGEHLVVQTFLRSGDSGAYGLNLRPDYQTLALQWWEPAAASVGASFAIDGNGARSWREQSAPESEWSLFRLLDAAREPARRGESFEWPVGTPVPGTNLRVGFQLKSDPREIFRSRPGEEVSAR